MITLESITKKLGFNPLTYQYPEADDWAIDDSIPNPFEVLNVDELNFLIKNTPNDSKHMIMAN